MDGPGTSGADYIIVEFHHIPRMIERSKNIHDISYLGPYAVWHEICKIRAWIIERRSHLGGRKARAICPGAPREQFGLKEKKPWSNQRSGTRNVPPL